MGTDFGGKYTVKKKDPLKAFYPVIGLILAAIAGGVAYFASPFALDFLKTNLLRTAQLPPDDQMLIVVGIMIFLVIIALFGMIYAAFAPKTDKRVSEKSLLEDKAQMDLERRRNKSRKKQMRSKMKAANKDWENM